MPQRNSLSELLSELETTLRGDWINAEERARLQRLHAELEAALHERSHHQASPHLRDDVQSALQRAQAAHPKLTDTLGRVLDALSDLGI